MNDDALFLVVFFCTAALSGLWSSLDDRQPAAGGVALQTVPQATTAPVADSIEQHPNARRTAPRQARNVRSAF
ncbi:hypothetical protein [Methylotetracoccus oryzae]|uniref:hypothetical protein n=1 Tax=Methylotetracoccus oryzae TaxID=1919059 RepID=UPI00111A87B2|nr:hypothetical protein [Methylotetracoccus oryzae]